MPTLAQGILAQGILNQLVPQTPPPLAPPPLWERIAFEHPFALGLILVVAAAAAHFALPAQRKRPLSARNLLALLAALGFALPWLVTTHREQGRQLTRDLVAAVATADRPGMDRLLADTFVLSTPLASTQVTKEQTIETATRVLGPGGSYAVAEADVQETQASQEARDLVRVQTRVRVRFAQGGVGAASWWRVDWQQGPDGQWRAIGVQSVSLPPIARGGV